MKKTHKPLHRERKKNSGFIDFDYLDKLSESEKDWLSKFSSEFYEATFSDDPLHPKEQHKAIQRSDWKKRQDVFSMSDRVDLIENETIDTQPAPPPSKRKKKPVAP